MLLALVAPACVPVAAPSAAVELAGPVRYACDGGKGLTVDYRLGEDPPAIGIDIDGPETLLQEPAPAGLRFAWPSDGSYHIWELQDGMGRLSYRDGERGTVTPVRTGCRA